MRRDLHVSLLGVLLVTLVASGVHAQTKVTLRFMSGYVPTTPAPYSAVVKVIEEYERLNPHVDVIDIGRETVGDALLLRTMSPEPPDSIKTDIPVLTSFNAMGLLETAPDRLTETLRRLLYPVAVQSVTFGGRLKGVPVEGNVTGIIYNKRLLAESGVPHPPTSWTELSVIGPKLTRWNGNDMLRPAIGVNDNWFLDYAFPATILGEGGKLLDAQGNIYVDVPEVYSAMNLWDCAVNQSKYMVVGVSRFASGFLNGEVPMWWAEPYYAQTLKSRGIYEDMAAMALPRGSVTVGAVYRNHSYAVPTSAQNKEEAWRFLEWLATATVEGGTPLGLINSANACFPLARKDHMAPCFQSVKDFFTGFIDVMEIATSNKVWLEQGFAVSHLSNALRQVVQQGVAPQQAIRNAELAIRNGMAEFKRK